MKKKTLYIITIIGILLAVLIGLSLVKLNFIPILNNSLIVIEFFLLALVFINIGYLIGKIPLKKKWFWVLRIVFLAIYYGALGLGLFYYIIFSLFAFMDNNKVNYQGETYYYMDQGFVDPYYVFYKKTGLTMEQCGSGYEYLPELNEENLKKLIEGTYRENPSLESEELGTKQGETVDKFSQSPEEKEAYVRGLDESYFHQVADSNFYLVVIDKALGSSYLYYLVEKDQGEKIKLSFQDSNGKISHYQSEDRGLNFVEFTKAKQ